MTAVARRPAPLLLRVWAIVATLGAAVLFPAAWMQIALDCDPAWRSDVRADGAFRVDVCRAPLSIGFPGRSSDAPGYAVLRDAEGSIAGIVHVEMVGVIDRPAEWTDDGAEFKLSARFELPTPARPLTTRVAVDALWRLRALLGLLRGDSEFR